MHSWNLETKGLIEMINNQDGRIVGNVFNRLSDCLSLLSNLLLVYI